MVDIATCDFRLGSKHQVIFSNRKSVKYLKVCQALKAIVDDILVFGKTKSEHDQNLKNAMNRAREKGVRFNPEKCIVGVTETIFWTYHK